MWRVLRQRREVRLPNAKNTNGKVRSKINACEKKYGSEQNVHGNSENAQR